MTPTLKAAAPDDLERRVEVLEDWRADMEKERREDTRELHRMIGALHDKVNEVAQQVAELVGVKKGKSEGHTFWIAIVGAALVAAQIGAMFFLSKIEGR
jgi:hypothetical protein